MSKVKETAVIISQDKLTEDIYSMWINTRIANEAVPGQFVSVYTKDKTRLLPRPISICETWGSHSLRIVYRIAGEGTKEFSTYKAGDSIDILGPLGNGFPLKNDGPAILIGGGIGIPPMLELAKRLDCDKTIVLGYRNAETFLDKELEEHGRIVIATDDGSAGIKGNVIDAINRTGISGSIIYACGPTPMLKGVKAYALGQGIEAYISMEERMACGVGACLGCVCESVKTDDHSKVNNKRICKDGPVFHVSEVVL
ncbi:MAG: dihydroorotate dehydrogenase electron transfer subunit [Lachnospiraceae bacterium]|nr:dihydroorotate dehydrogenase electron transfer subunit [Lachnospiraceae bacterium]